MNKNEKMEIIRNRLAYIKGESHNSVHPSLIRDRIVELVDLMEWIMFEQISNAQPHTVPGVPLSQLDDPNRTRVTFVSDGQHMGGGFMLPPNDSPYGRAPQNASPFSAPSTPPPGMPIKSGDVQLIPGPIGGAGSVGNGQTIEFYNGPAHPGSGNGGQRVEFYGAPPTTDQPPVARPPVARPPVARPPVAQPLVTNQPQVQRPIDPRSASGSMELPVGPPVRTTVTNQPQQILPQAAPTLTTEAGDHVAPTPTISLPTTEAMANRPVANDPWATNPRSAGPMINNPSYQNVNPPPNRSLEIQVPIPMTDSFIKEISIPIPTRADAGPPDETTSYDPNFLIPGL